MNSISGQGGKEGRGMLPDSLEPVGADEVREQ